MLFVDAVMLVAKRPPTNKQPGRQLVVLDHPCRRFVGAQVLEKEIRVRQGRQITRPLFEPGRFLNRTCVNSCFCKTRSV